MIFRSVGSDKPTDTDADAIRNRLKVKIATGTIQELRKIIEFSKEDFTRLMN